MMIFYLIRQAEAAPAADLPAELWPLSESGKAQANHLIPKLGRIGINYLYSSQERCSIDTALPFALAYGLNILVLSELQDSCPVRETRRPSDDTEACSLQISNDSQDEHSLSVQRRIVKTIQSLMLHHPHDGVAVIIPSRLLALFLNAIDSQFDLKDWQSRDIPDMIRLIRGEYHISWTPVDHPRPQLTLVRQQDHSGL